MFSCPNNQKEPLKKHGFNNTSQVILRKETQKPSV